MQKEFPMKIWKGSKELIGETVDFGCWGESARNCFTKLTIRRKQVLYSVLCELLWEITKRVADSGRMFK
jgi:hypothetical protein